MYHDDSKGRAKRGIANPNRGVKRGDLTNRFPARMRQLQLTYDAHALSAGQLVKRLGREFEPWLPKPTLPIEQVSAAPLGESAADSPRPAGLNKAPTSPYSAFRSRARSVRIRLASADRRPKISG